jgi:hypothetical protein
VVASGGAESIVVEEEARREKGGKQEWHEISECDEMADAGTPPMDSVASGAEEGSEDDP